MTRPDRRLLLPVSALPFVPAGLPLWDNDRDHPCVAGEAMVPVDMPNWTDWVDVSEPGSPEGLPERMDALPWLLKYLGWRLFHAEEWEGDTVYVAFCGVAVPHRRFVCGPKEPRRFGNKLTLDPWPDLEGLSLDDRLRALVCAAACSSMYLSPRSS